MDDETRMGVDAHGSPTNAGCGSQPTLGASHASRPAYDLPVPRPSLFRVGPHSGDRVGLPVRGRPLQPARLCPDDGGAPIDTPALAEAETRARGRSGSDRILREPDRLGLPAPAGGGVPPDLHAAGDVRNPPGVRLPSAVRPQPVRRQFLRLAAGPRAPARARPPRLWRPPTQRAGVPDDTQTDHRL